MTTILLLIVLILTGLLIWVTDLYFKNLHVAASEKAVRILHTNMFSADFNANDFFGYATAMAVTVAEGDLDWVLAHIEEHGSTGLDACMAYIQNLEPIPKYAQDPAFMKAIGELQAREQPVIGDIDYQSYRYCVDGPYRKIEDYK